MSTITTDRQHTSNAATTPVRRSTETKSFYKTSEFLVWVLASVGVLIATYVVDDRRLTAFHGWMMLTVLAVGYMVARGLAKAGSREPYTEQRD